MSSDVWTYRSTTDLGTNVDVSGYDVEATDGSIGKVDEATYETGRSYLVVDTGPWIFGKKVMLPAGVVNHIDHEERRVYVDRTKEQIKSAPEYDPDAAYPFCQNCYVSCDNDETCPDGMTCTHGNETDRRVCV